MILKTEIKDFVKKVLLLWIFLSLLINLLVSYFAWFETKEANAQSTNDINFKRLDNSYLWTTWVAVSLNIWTKTKLSWETPINITSEVLPISFILADKTKSRDKIITSNMLAIAEYLNVVKTDINSLLDQSSDREAMLESYTDELKYRYKITLEHIDVLNKQWSELKAAIQSSEGKISRLKDELSQAYKKLDYDKTQEKLDEYLKERDIFTYANTYLIFVSKFINSYTIINNYNKVYLDTIINNSDALIKNAKIVLPDSWTELLKKLELVKTEAEFKSWN